MVYKKNVYYLTVSMGQEPGLGLAGLPDLGSFIGCSQGVNWVYSSQVSTGEGSASKLTHKVAS